MAPRVSLETELARQEGKEMARLLVKSKPPEKPIPFGQEQVTTRTARARFERMTPDERRAFIQTNGLDQTIRLVRGLRKPALGGGDA